MLGAGVSLCALSARWPLNRASQKLTTLVCKRRPLSLDSESSSLSFPNAFFLGDWLNDACVLLVLPFVLDASVSRGTGQEVVMYTLRFALCV